MQDQRETTEGLEPVTTEFINDVQGAPVAAPEDYAPEEPEVTTAPGTHSDGASVNVAGPYVPTQADLEREAQYSRQRCLELAVGSLGTEIPDSGVVYAQEVIRRAEQFRRYVETGNGVVE